MLLNIIIILITTYTIWYASEFLGKATKGIGRKYKLSSSVKGATLDAVGSSFPEFCTVVFCLIAGSFEAGIGAIIGSALFNILVIPSICVIYTKNISINKEVIYRDGLIYILTVTLLIIAIIYGPINPNNNQEHLIPQLVGLGAIISYIGYIILLIFQSRNDYENENDEEFGLFKIIIFFVIGLIGIAVSTHFLVDASLTLFNSLGFSEAITGVTILAVATSLPDAFLSLISAKNGESDAALSNALGSNTFDILICLGLPIFYIGGIYVNWSESAGILYYLWATSIISMFLIWTNWKLTKCKAQIALLIYLIFIVLIFLKVL